jgi:hypothetical protein
MDVVLRLPQVEHFVVRLQELDLAKELFPAAARPEEAAVAGTCGPLR